MSANKKNIYIKHIFMRGAGVVVCGSQESANSDHTEPLTKVCGQITWPSLPSVIPAGKCVKCIGPGKWQCAFMH